MTRRLFARALVMVSLAILGSCAGGGGSDVPNDLSGTVLSESGEAASGTKVFLRSARSTPDQPGPVWQTTADTRGEYHLPLVADTETWLLEWRDSACGCGTTRILASDWIRQERIPPVRLAKWGTLRGTLANGTSRPTEGIRVVIPGLQLSAIVEADGSWQIADVPEGIYQPAVEGAPAGAEVVADSVKIQAATGSVSPPVVVSDRPSRLVWMGLLRSPEGKPLAGVPLLYLPAEGKDTLKTGSVSDDSGRIAWVPTDSARGTVILANATNRWSGAVEAHLLQPDVFPTPDTLVLTKIAILRSLRATVVLPATAPSQTASEGFRLVLAGTSRRSDVVHSGDPVVFDSLAPGVHRLTAVRESNDAPWPVEWSLTIGDGDLDTLLKPSLMDIEDSTSWKALGEITLTTPEIQGVWLDVPVRVVLDGKMDMASGAPDASDLRIFQADGQPARFWVSRWDPARDRAEVWIRVDTMAAGRSFRWTFRQGNPSTKIVARQHVDSVFLAKEWLAMWNSTTGKSMVKGGYSLNGDLLADSSSVFSHTFVLESNDYLEAAVPMMGYDSGYTFLASFRFDSLPPTGNLVRLSGDNDNYSLAMDSTESLPRQARLVWGERFSDTVFGQSAPPSDPNGTSRIDLGTDLPIAVSFAPTQTIAYRLGSPSAPLPPLTMTNKSLAGGHFVEVGGFGRSIGFAGTMSLPRLSRGVMDPNRLALEAFNLQTQPSWIRVDRHGSVTGPSKNP